MTFYYLHLRDHVDEIIDPDGVELASLEAVKTRALVEARGIIAADADSGIIDLRYRIDVEDAAGQIVFSLPFKHAVSIIHETPK